MKASVPQARLLVASDNLDDARMIVQQLTTDYPDVRLSTDAATAIEEFDELRPEVLVLAFDALDKAQAYSLRLYRQSQSVHGYSHRNVLLCSKDELTAAYQLCKEGSFDDYVLFWPHAHDALRLSMSVLQAVRQLKAEVPAGPSNIDLISHVKHLAAMQSVVEQHDDETSPMGGGATSPSGPQRPQALKSKLGPHIDLLQALREKVGRIRPLILVVEDDPFSRKLTAKALESAPYQLAFAHDGTGALALIRRMQPDLILMDVQLPDIDGVTLTQKLKGAPHLADIPVLMLTGEARRETLQSSMSAGAAGFLVKPFTPQSLRQKLDSFLSTTG